MPQTNFVSIGWCKVTYFPNIEINILNGSQDKNRVYVVKNYANSLKRTRFFSFFPFSSVLSDLTLPFALTGGVSVVTFLVGSIGLGYVRLSTDGINLSMSDGMRRSGNGDRAQVSWRYK